MTMHQFVDLSWIIAPSLYLSACLLTVLYIYHKVDQELNNSDFLSNADSSCSTPYLKGSKESGFHDTVVSALKFQFPGRSYTFLLPLYYFQPMPVY